MAEPSYVPVLPARPSARKAYEALTPSVRAAVAPLWVVPPRDPAACRRARRHPVHETLAHIARVQEGRPAWVDTRGGESDADPRPVEEALRDVPARTALRPVTGPERSAWQQAACAAAARACGDGLGIRIAPAALADERRLEARLRRLLAELADLPLDLLLDFGDVQDDHRFAFVEESALRALALLGPLHGWRTVAVLAGSCPGADAVPDGYGAPLAEAERYDWDLWHVLGRSPDGRRLRLTYGDYGAGHPRSTARPADPDDGSPWGLLRHTGERTFLLGKVPTCADGHAADIRRTAAEIVATPDFEEAPHSAAKDWMRACAAGRGSEGAGHPGVWAWAAHNQHLTFVVHRLQRLQQLQRLRLLHQLRRLPQPHRSAPFHRTA
ncbi:hypothetical protein ACIRSU_06145 [Streptomyces sp. NPDC101160]|uniref:beta family protein n=1 Tax=Streptomyces sp. NPDC101160 TaxID=3366118 RepID=UPI00381B9DE3